ncbi:MAG: hypothetical protein LUH42_05645, partial [Oscillospiraceae bacterium]|nr:hypothetical protein [Oscillospiraceae bacterium]
MHTMSLYEAGRSSGEVSLMESLNRIREKIATDGGKPPKICCVICGLSNAAYQREDGVYVVPITALKN